MKDVQVGFPFAIDDRGQMADPDYEEHIRELIEQLLFTDPGQRVNRPEFGTGLLKMVFENESSEIIAPTKHLVQASLTRWLGTLIKVEEVDLRVLGDELQITISYIVRLSQQRQIETFNRRGGGWRE